MALLGHLDRAVRNDIDPATFGRDNRKHSPDRGLMDLDNNGIVSNASRKIMGGRIIVEMDGGIPCCCASRGSLRSRPSTTVVVCPPHSLLYLLSDDDASLMTIRRSAIEDAVQHLPHPILGPGRQGREG